MNGKPPIPITFSGGMNNVDTPLKLLRPLTALNTTTAGSAIHTIYRGKGKKCILVGYSTVIAYLNGTTLTSLLTGLASSAKSIGHAGDWVYLGDGTYNRSIYLPGPTGCSWGQAIPSAAPTVDEVTKAGTDGLTGTYLCTYRYKITLPDGAILRTGLSGVTTVTPDDQDLDWSAIVHSTYTGAGTLQVELFRTIADGSTYYLLTTLTTGTTTFSDDGDTYPDSVI